MLLQPEKSDLVLAISKDAEANKDRSNCTILKNSEVNKSHKNKYGKLKTILPIWYFKHKR